VTDVPGLYFLGLTWQYRRGSALIGWVKDDASSSPSRSRPSNRRRARKTSG
jgi:hypothetical protein